MSTSACMKGLNETDRTTAVKRRSMGKSSGRVEWQRVWNEGVRLSIKVQLCNFIPVPAQWGMRLSSIWTCSGDLLTSFWGATSNTHTYTYTLLEPLSMSAPLQGNQASRDRSALAHVYIHGLNLASFLSAAGKRNVFNLHNPHLACSTRSYGESRPIVRGVWFLEVCASLYTWCLYGVCQNT